MLTYAGVNIGCPAPADVAELQGKIPVSHLYDLTRLTWPGNALAALGWTSQKRFRPPELQTLHWPVGNASEFAVGYFLVSEMDLATIRTAVYSGTSGAATAQNLVLNDGVRSALTLPLWMLPPRPLAKDPNKPTQGNWLLTLVDARYFWWQKAAEISVTAGTTTWAQLFASIASALGITLTVDSVPSAYGKPPADFGTSYEYLPPLLDAACRSVGMRFVAGLDGTYRVWSSTSAQAQLATNITALGQAAPTGNGVLAGGVLPMGVPADANAFLPSSVSVAFPIVVSGAANGEFYLEVVTLSSLGLTGLTNVAGTANTKLFKSSLAANGISPSNTTELLNLATQLATDYYQWSLASPDIVYSGVPTNWVLSGMEQSLEFFHDYQTIKTRLQRPPWDVQSTELLEYGSAGSVSEFFNFTGVSLSFSNDTFSLTNNTFNSGGGNTYNYSATDTINFNGGPVYFDYPETWYLQEGNEWSIDGSGTLQINSPVEFGGPTLWDCVTIAPPASTTNNYTLTAITAAVTGATNASPIVLTVPGWTTQPRVGQTIWVQNVNGNTAANGVWRVQAVTATTVTLANSQGNGAFASSPSSSVTIIVPFYDVDTSAGDCTITGIQPAAIPLKVNTGDVTGATNASPIVLTVPAWTTQPVTGNLVAVDGVLGNLAANGVFTVLSSTATTVTLSGTTGSGAFVASPGSTVELLQTQPQLIILKNDGPHNLTLTNQDTASTNIYRIQFPPKYGTAVAQTLTLNPNDTVWLWWDDCYLQTWAILSCTVAVYTTCTSVLLTNTTYNNYALPTLIAPHTEINITNTTGTATITGIASQSPSFGPVVITLINTSTQSLVINHASAGSTAGNRIYLPPTYGTTSVTLAQYDTITLWYDSCAGTPGWYVLACTVDIDSGGSTTGTNATGSLTNQYTLTNSFANIGLSAALPVAGTYLLSANVSGFAQGGTGGATLTIDARLFDSTASAAVANSLSSIFYIGSCIAGTQYGNSGTINLVYTVTGATTINIQASGSATLGVFTGSIRAGGYTRLTYVRLS